MYIRLTFIITLFCILFLGSCKKNENNLPTNLPSTTETQTPQTTLNLTNVMPNKEVKVTWQLSPVYSTDNNETALIKIIDNQPTVFPSLWRKFTQLDRDPTEGETGFVIPPNYQAIWLDNISLPNPTYPMVFVKILSPEGYTTATLYQLQQDAAQALWTLESLGDITLAYNSSHLPVFYDRKLNGNTQITTQYGYTPQTNTVTLENRQSQVVARNSVVSQLLQLPVIHQEELLQGAWLKVEQNNEAKQPNTFLFFDINNRQLLFAQKDMMEIFDWPTSTKVYNGLYLTAINSQIDHIRHNLHLAFDNNNQLVLSFSGDTVWGGTYRRMNSQEKILSLRLLSAITPIENQIDGSYTTANGDEYTFTYPHFTLKTKDSPALQGTYSHYYLGDQEILQLHFINQLGLVSSRKNYLVQLNNFQEGKQLVKIINLSSGHLSLWGFETDEEESLYLKSITTLGG